MKNFGMPLNRLSDINFDEKPRIFYSAPVVIFDDYGSKFDDFVKKCCPSLAASRKDYLSLAFFCEDLEIDRDSDSCIISRENLNLLLFLQNRNLDTVLKIIKRCNELTGSIWDSLEI